MKIFSNFSDKLFWLVIAMGFVFLFTIPSPEKNTKFKRLTKQIFPELKYPYVLPTLKFAFNDLEPYMDEQTVNIHYTKHHQGYVDKLNSILERYPEWQNYTLEDLLANLNALPEELSIVVKAHGGGHFNHTLFWTTLCKKSSVAEGSEPSGIILEKINSAFGSLENFKKDFLDKALSIVGSGWVWLCVDNSGELKTVATYNHETPLFCHPELDSGSIRKIPPTNQKLKPILILDVWEHAYYLKYQNKRAGFVDAWWNLIDWKEVEKIYNNIE
ncbi:MAG: superoxide dismutase [bacterium]